MYIHVLSSINMTEMLRWYECEVSLQGHNIHLWDIGLLHKILFWTNLSLYANSLLHDHCSYFNDRHHCTMCTQLPVRKAETIYLSV